MGTVGAIFSKLKKKNTDKNYYNIIFNFNFNRTIIKLTRMNNYYLSNFEVNFVLIISTNDLHKEYP